MTRLLRLLIAYDGTDYHGWQHQPELTTVQGVLEDVIQRVVRHPLSITASGRTDAGVHAAGQVAAFHSTSRLPCDRLRHAINHRLPDDISILRVSDAPRGFHATRSASRKLYRYRLFSCCDRRLSQDRRRYVYHHARALNLETMSAAGRRFEGAHNFKAMTPMRAPARLSYVRTVYACDVYRVGDEIRFDVEGSGFLYRQVRNMVGTLLDVGRGRFSADDILPILDSEARDRAGPTAPARGLCLQWVRYPPDREIRPEESPGHEPMQPATSSDPGGS